MAVSGKTAAPHEIPYFLGSDSPPDMGDVTEAMANRIHSRLDNISTSQLVVPGGEADDGKLLIVKDGAAAYRAMKGDATIDEDGNLQLGAKVVGTPELGDKAVTTAKVDDGAVTAGKLAANAVETAKIKDQAVTTPKLEDASVTAAKLVNEAVSLGKVSIFEGYVFNENSINIVGFPQTQAQVTNVPPGLYVVTAYLRTDGGSNVENSATMQLEATKSNTSFNGAKVSEIGGNFTIRTLSPNLNVTLAVIVKVTEANETIRLISSAHIASTMKATARALAVIGIKS